MKGEGELATAKGAVLLVLSRDVRSRGISRGLQPRALFGDFVCRRRSLWSRVVCGGRMGEPLLRVASLGGPASSGNLGAGLQVRTFPVYTLMPTLSPDGVRGRWAHVHSGARYD